MYSLDDTLDKILGQRLGSGINAMYHCPLHEDRTPSLSAHREEGVWKCHSCGQGGDIEKLALLTGEELTPDFIWDRAIRKVAEVPPVEKNFAPLANALYEQGLQSDRGNIAIRNYLSKRDIYPEARHHFWLGWDSYRISFPYWDDDSRKRGTVPAIKYRDVHGNKSYEAGGKRAIYNVEDIRGSGYVVVLEGETDTIFGWSKIPKPWRVCGVPGAKISEAQWELWSLDFLFAKRILIAFDADEAGDTGAATAMKVLGEKAERLRPAEELDFTEHYLKHGELAGVELFDSAPQSE
jgi:DNA primase